jgi:hypothetical protein
MSVKRTMREVDSAEFSEWKAFWEIEDPEYRADFRAAIIANALAASHGVKIPIQDFMPFQQPPKKPQTEADKAAALQVAIVALGVAKNQ